MGVVWCSFNHIELNSSVSDVVSILFGKSSLEQLEEILSVEEIRDMLIWPLLAQGGFPTSRLGDRSQGKVWRRRGGRYCGK